MKYISSLLASLLILGCSQSQPVPEPTEAAQPETSRFHGLDLKSGMNREDVEKQVFALLQQPQNYSPYANNLSGGTVQYPDGDWVLEVKYKAGVPAPWVETPDGSMQHYPPVDETLLEYSIRRTPNNTSEDIP